MKINSHQLELNQTQDNHEMIFCERKFISSILNYKMQEKQLDNQTRNKTSAHNGREGEKNVQSIKSCLNINETTYSTELYS